MHSEPAIAPPATPVAGIDPPPVNTVTAAVRGPLRATSAPRRSAPVRLVRKVMSVLRGDKYLVGAYPPEWQAPSTRSDGVRRGDGTVTTAADAVSAMPSNGR